MERLLRYSWIIPDRLAVGERPASYADLHQMGFGAVLSLQEEGEPRPEDTPPEGIQFLAVEVRDGIVGGVPSLAQLERAVKGLEGFLKRGLRTYVHCFAGVGRSPTICMAYLARSEKLSLGEAYRRVAALHDATSPTAGQLAALAEFLGS